MTFLLVGVKVKDFTKYLIINILLRILLWILLIFMGFRPRSRVPTCIVLERERLNNISVNRFEDFAMGI